MGAVRWSSAFCKLPKSISERSSSFKGKLEWELLALSGIMSATKSVKNTSSGCCVMLISVFLVSS